MNYLLFAALFSLSTVAADVPAEDTDEYKELSYFTGYSFWKTWEKRGVTFDIDRLIDGIRDAKNGHKISSKFDGESLSDIIYKFQKSLVKRKLAKHLSLAEEALKKVSLDPDVVEIEKDKLYYKITHEGHGQTITNDSYPLMRFSLRSLEEDGEKELLNEIEPQRIELQNTIDGFLLGVQGMKEGEKRTLYVHPDLGYGCSGRFEPNVLLIFDVEAVSL